MHKLSAQYNKINLPDSLSRSNFGRMLSPIFYEELYENS